MVELGKYYKVLFQVHDELILLADAKKSSKVCEHVETIMSTSPWWAGNLPVACESGVGNNYGDCK
jgi:DNA polymerase I-like protein with 3'-5' exonuclease and polymerase domains